MDGRNLGRISVYHDPPNAIGLCETAPGKPFTAVMGVRYGIGSLPYGPVGLMWKT